MGKIKKLSEEVVAHIAAGEVVGRPAHVVKELIENALDAQATDILVEVENYGLDRITVIDNGEGMNEEDAVASVLPHATSKLSDITDLHTIKTLGFRGEALSSIAAVSTLEIKSRKRGSSEGTQIRSRHGLVEEPEAVGMPEGTHVSVLSLFSNTPARKKFLKSSQSELRAIVDVVTHFVFSHPTVSFKLIHNQRVLLDEQSTSLKTRLENMYGSEEMHVFLPIETKELSSLLSLSGFLAKPQKSGNAQKLLLFVNNRRVTDSLLSTAVREAYGTLLMAREYPVGILFVYVAPETVDVNVHPTKREVRFAYPKEVFADVKQAVETLLSNNNLTYQNVSFDSPLSDLKHELKEVVLSKEVAHIGTVYTDEVLQVHNSFLIAEATNGIQIIDQHAAHESLLYFEFLDAFDQKKKAVESTELSKASVVSLSPSLFVAVEEHLDTLNHIGFEIEPFGANTAKVSKIPSLYRGQDLKDVLEAAVGTLAEGAQALTTKEHKLLATLACKSAIKAGQSLPQAERAKLIQALEQKHFAYTCPHGRPVKIDVTKAALERMFRRK